MKSVKLTLSAALLGLALGGCGTDNKGNNPISDIRNGGGNAPTATAPEALKRTSVTIDEDLAHQLGLDLKNNCVTAVGDLAKQATVEFGGHACDADAKKGEKTFTLTTELAAVKGGKDQAQQGKDQGKNIGPDLSPRLYYLVLSTTRRAPYVAQAPEQGKQQQAPAPTQKPDQGKPVVPPAPTQKPDQGKPVVPPAPTQKPDQGKPVQQAPEQGKVAPKFREVTVTARVGEIVVMPYVHVIPTPTPEQGKVQQQAPTQKPDQGKPVVPAPTQKPDQGKPVVPPAPTQKPDQGKPVVPPAPTQKPDQGKPEVPTQKPEQGQQQQAGKTGEQGQVAEPKTEVLEHVVLTKLCTAGKSGASYSAVCKVEVKDGRFVAITLNDGQGEEVKGSEKIVEDKPVVTPDQGKTQQQQQAQAPVQKAPEQGKVTAPVQKQPEQGKVVQAPAPTQQPEQGGKVAPKAPTSPAPKQAVQPKQEQRSSQQGPKAA